MLTSPLFHANDQSWWPKWPQQTTPAAALLGMHSKCIEPVHCNSILLNFNYDHVIS